MDSVELVFVKSRVHIHVSKLARDNIPGFLLLLCAHKDDPHLLMLLYTPELMLLARDLERYRQADLLLLALATPSATPNPHPQSILVAAPPTLLLLLYAFLMPLTAVYSVQVRPPHANLWYGSIVIHAVLGASGALPALFFHDDESPLTIASQKHHNQRMDPFAKDNNKMRTSEFYWGGDDFVNALSNHVVVERLTLDKSVFLINPTTNDRAGFAPATRPPPKKKAALQQSLNQTLTSVKWKVLTAIASMTTKARLGVLELVDEHSSQLPTPVRNLLRKPEVRLLADDFDGARVYLAKWAMSVQAEAARLSDVPIVLDNDDGEFGGAPGFRRAPVTRKEWDSFFDRLGRLKITVDEVKTAVFHGSVDVSEGEGLRGEVWLYLLGVFPWDLSTEERDIIVSSFVSSYVEMRSKWSGDMAKHKTNDFFKDQVSRINKDVKRTDRDVEIFRGEAEASDEEEDGELLSSSEFNNPHLFNLRLILLTFNEYYPNLGYVQGMNDLLSPLYICLYDYVGSNPVHHEALTFWAFTKVMENLEKNFLRDQSGIKQQMETLNEMIQLMMPEFHAYLVEIHATHLFFLFRMLLVWFKREFAVLDDVLAIWDVLFTNFYLSQYNLFVVLAVLHKHQKIMRDFLKEDYEVLKYVNDLAMASQDVGDLLERAEKLFGKFRMMVDQVDRQEEKDRVRGWVYKSNAEIVEEAQDEAAVYGDVSSTTTTPEHSEDEETEPLEIPPGAVPFESRISPNLRALLKRLLVMIKEGPRPEGVLGG